MMEYAATVARGAETTIAFWRRAYDEERVRHEATLISERARYDVLAERYHALTLAGGAPPVPPLERVVPKPPDIVTQAMITKAKGSRFLLKQFSEFVAEQRLLGTDEDEIARLILAGVDDDAGVPG